MAVRDSSKPLDVLTVKHHKEGVLADAAPYRGLRLVANKNGTKTWIYRYRDPDSKLRQMKLGDYPYMGLAEARAALLEQRVVKNKHGDPREYRNAEKNKQKELLDQKIMADYLVSQMIEDYLQEHIAQHRAKKGYLECRRMLTQDVLPTLGATPVKTLRRHHIHELIQKIAARAPRIAGMVKAELKGAVEHAISAGRVDMDFSNPVFGVKAPKSNSRTRVLTESELIQLVKWLPSSSLSEQVKAALTLMLFTGCRGGEIVSIEWRNVNFDRAELYFPVTKNGLSHTVYMSRQVMDVMRSIPQGKSAYVFPSIYTKSHLRQHAIVWQLTKYRPNLGIDHWTSHDLRRTAGTGLARLGCSRVIQDRMLNHIDSSVSGIYDRHNYDNEAREWWQRWADHLDKLYSS